MTKQERADWDRRVHIEADKRRPFAFSSDRVAPVPGSTRRGGVPTRTERNPLIDPNRCTDNI